MAKSIKEKGLIAKQVTIDGKRKVFYGRTAREVNQKMIEYKGEKEAGPLFDDVASAWWVQTEKTVKYGTLRSYKSSYDDAVKYFHGKRIAEIKPKSISNYLKWIKGNGKAQATIRNRHSVLNLIFAYWCSDMDGESNPSLSVKNLRGEKKKRVQPSDDTMELLIKHTDGEMGLLAALAMYGGLRIGEIIALQWRDVDLESSLLHIRHSCTWRNNQPIITTPKTENSVRDVPILQPLAQRISEEGKMAGTRYVIGGGTTPLTASQERKRWLSYCKELGLARQEEKDYTPYNGKRQIHWNVDVTAHQLRHYCATLLDKYNVPMKTRQLWLGHADIHTTMQIYTHQYSGEMEAARKLIDKSMYIQSTHGT